MKRGKEDREMKETKIGNRTIINGEAGLRASIEIDDKGILKAFIYKGVKRTHHFESLEDLRETHALTDQLLRVIALAV